MAGAAPARTQQLLDRSLRHRQSRTSVICGKGWITITPNYNQLKPFFLDKWTEGIAGEREHATALYMACRHLPTPLLSSPGERAGMLAEAAKTLERIGDRKKLEECYKLMKTFSTKSVMSS